MTFRIATPLPADPGPEAALDPTLLLTIFGAALLAAVAGFVGAAIESRREHKRWLRERRYEAFVRAYALMKAFDLNWSKQKKIATGIEEARTTEEEETLRILQLQDEADQLYATVSTELSPIIVLGPASVAEWAIQIQLAYEADDKDAQGNAEAKFVAAARNALAIPR